jgi:hypothetical protein
VNDKESRKKLTDAYKERSRTQTGGVYIIRNRENGRVFIDLTADMSASVNRYDFAKQMNSCPYSGNVRLSKDWSTYGAAAFAFEIAETMEKNPNQTPAEFREDLDLLKKLWIEKYDPAVLY